LVLGQYYRVQVNPAGAATVTDDVGNVAVAVDDLVRAPTKAGESSLGATFTWRKVADRKAAGGSFFAEHRKGARASWTFSGKSVAWLTVTGPTYGKADVYVDGVRKATVNNYAKTTKHGVVRAVKGLAKGTHTIEIRVLGKKGAKAAKGTFVAIDGFKVGKTVTATPTLTKVSWQKASNSAASDKTFVAADLKGQTLKSSVRGTSVAVLGVRGPAFGKAGVYVDGKLAKTVDLYAEAVKWGPVATVTGLADTTHTVVVKVLGSKNAKSTGTTVVVDGLSVG
jgi:bacillopeptidase F